MLVFSENAYSSQTKLIGQSLHVSEHGIGYSNLAFAGFKMAARQNLKSQKIVNKTEVLYQKCPYFSAYRISCKLAF